MPDRGMTVRRRERAGEVYPDGDRAFIVGPAPALAAIQAGDQPSTAADPTIEAVPLPTR